MGNPTLNDMRIGQLTYNGFTFPALTDIKADTKAVYDDGENSVKWYEVTFDVSFIYYPTAEDLPANVDYSSGADYNDYSSLPGYMDRLADDLRHRLLQPNQQFSIAQMGFGDIITNNSTSGMDNFLMPISCTWAPIAGNIIAKFNWKFVLKLSPGCAVYLNANGITSLNYEVNWSQSEDESFQFIRSISGTVEFRNNRYSLSSDSNRPKAFGNLQSLNSAIRDKIYPVLATMFPRLPGYKRSRSLTLGANNRTLAFNFNDTEIMRDAAPPRPILELKLKNSLQSDIAQGFRVWKVGFQGEVRVGKARQNASTSFSSQKKLAWVVIGRMIDQRLAQVTNSSYTQGHYFIGENGPVEGYETTSIIQDTLQVNDDVNEPTFSFSFQYRIFGSEAVAFKASGMFNTMGLPGEDWARREQYLQFIGAGNDGVTPWPQDRPPVFDACSSPSIESNVETARSVTESASYGSSNVRAMEEDKRTIWHENAYDVEELNQTSIHIPLHSSESRREVARTDNPRGIVPVSDGYSPAAPNPIVTNPTAKTYIITMYGFSLTSGIPRTPPNLISYGNKPCIKIGADKIKVVEKVVGVVLDSSKRSTTIYRTAWQKKYLVYGQLQPNTPAYANMDNFA